MHDKNQATYEELFTVIYCVALDSDCSLKVLDSVFDEN